MKDPDDLTSFERVRAVFDAVFELQGAAREARLHELCGSDTALVHEVRALLGDSLEAAERLEPPESSRDAGSPSLDGTTIGPFTVLERLGHGGMGEVHRAVQSHPVTREVALKVIRERGHGREILERFQREQRALALMEHENIARILDAGATSDGRPWFAMELCPGPPITTYCIERDLPLDARVALFAQVCRGVHHAHQKGIVHRDLKPSNLLVVEREGQAVPKIIDFGIARAHEQEGETFTRTGQCIGTPAYMSPEQALGSPDIDTRTDIFSLGVVLYELLTDRLPLEVDPTREGGWLAWQRRLLETDPVRPSRRVTQLDDVDPARRRRAGTRQRQLRGELDWITLEALERDPARRYASAHEFALDLERYLAGRPVHAGPPGRVLRVGRFLRRHRISASLVALTTLSLILGTVLSWIATLNAQRSEERALDARARERRGRYVASVGAASYALDAQNLVEARALLANCPETLRGFEWHLLDARVQQHALALEHVFEAHVDGVLELAFRPGREQLVSASADGTTRLWDLETGKALQRFVEPWLPPGSEASRDSVLRACFSPDGRLLLTSHLTGRAVLRDLDSGAVVLEVKNGYKAFGLGFDSRGERFFLSSGLAEPSHEHEIRFHDVRTGTVLKTLRHDRPMGSLVARLSPDDRWLAEGTHSLVLIWNVEEERVEHHVPLGNLPKAMAWSAAGTQLVVADATARPAWRIDARTGRVETHYVSPRAALRSASFLPDQRVVTGDEVGGICVWSSDQGIIERTFLGHVRSIQSLASRGDRIASGSTRGRIHVWNLRTTPARRRIEHMPLGRTQLIAHPRGSGFAARSLLGPLETFDADGRRSAVPLPIQRWPGGRHHIYEVTPVSAFAWNPMDPNQLVIATRIQLEADPIRNGRLLWYDPVAGGMHAAPDEEQIRHAFFTSDGKQLVTVSELGTILVRNTRDGATLRRMLPFPGAMLESACLARDDRTLFVTVPIPDSNEPRTDRHELAAIDTWTGNHRRLAPGSQHIYALALCRDDTVLLSGEENVILVRDPRTGTVLERWEGHQGAVRSIAVRRDGLCVASVASDRSIRFWDARDGTALLAMETTEDQPWDVAFAGVGERDVITSHTSGAILLHRTNLER